MSGNKVETLDAAVKKVAKAKGKKKVVKKPVKKTAAKKKVGAKRK